MWKCHKCGKPVFFAERKQSLGYDWHPECLRCEECGKRLNPGQHAEHKGVPYCHVPCYGALFGPQLFGHGTKVESHKSFGQAGLARASDGPSLPRDHLESKVKLFNQFYDNKAVKRSREVNGRIVLEGALKVYWGIQGLIHLKEDDDQRTVVTIRKRNSCRYGNSVELSIDSMVQDLSCKDSPDSVEPVMETSIMSLGDGDSTDISLTESMSYDTCSIGEASLGSGNSSKEVSPDHKSNTLPSKLQLKELEWDEMDELLQVERKSDDSSKLYQTMPSPLSTNAGNSDLSEISRGTNTNTTTVTTETYETAPNTNSTNNDEEDTSSSTMKPMDFEDFKKQIQKDYINGANDMQSSRDDTLKSNQPIDPSRINDSLKLYSGDAMSKSYAGETPAMRAQGANSYYLNAGIINANRINDTLSLSSRESSKNYALQKSESAVSPRSGSSIGYEDLDATLTRSKSGPNWCGAYKNGEDFETLKPSTVKKQERPTISIRMNCYTELKNESNEDDATTEPTSTENGDTSMQNLIGSEDSNCEVVLRRPPKTGSVAIKRRSGNKRNRAIKLRRRCSINGHFYNRDTSFFTPPHGSHMSVWVTSLVNTQEVINLILEKYKVESRPQNFALFIIKDNGEQKRLRDDDYPLLVRVLLGPHEDVARIFLMDAQETPEISNEVAQFLNLSFQECRSILDRYNEEMEREAMKIRQKYADLRQHILQRMESLKVRL